jgi:hypothetical protein
MVRDPDVDDSATLVAEEHQHEKHAACEGWDYEEVHRHEGRQMIPQEGSPRLGGRSTASPEES